MKEDKSIELTGVNSSKCARNKNGCIEIIDHHGISHEFPPEIYDLFIVDILTSDDWHVFKHWGIPTWNRLEEMN